MCKSLLCYDAVVHSKSSAIEIHVVTTCAHDIYILSVWSKTNELMCAMTPRRINPRHSLQRGHTLQARPAGIMGAACAHPSPSPDEPGQ